MTFRLLLSLAMAGAVLYQLISGKLLSRGWKAGSTRREQPAWYWSLVLLQALVTAGMLYVAIHELRSP